MVGTALSGLGGLCGLVAFVCWIMVVVKMFQNGQTGMGIASIVTFCCGIGYIVALVIGWQNVDRWGIRQLMLVFSISFGVGTLLSVAGWVMGGQLIAIPQ